MIQIENLQSPSVFIAYHDENDWRIPIFKYLNGDELKYDKFQMKKVKK